MRMIARRISLICGVGLIAVAASAALTVTETGSTLIAKIGAVATAFLFPILLDAIGTRLLLYGLIVASVLGALVTWQYRIETAGVNPDRLGEVEPEAKSPGTPAGAHLRAH